MTDLSKFRELSVSKITLEEITTEIVRVFNKPYDNTKDVITLDGPLTTQKADATTGTCKLLNCVELRKYVRDAMKCGFRSIYLNGTWEAINDNK